MIVDYHAHWNPPAYLEFIERRTESPRAQRQPGGGWTYTTDEEPTGGQWTWAPLFQDLDANVADMDAAGIGVSVVSPALLGNEPTAQGLGFAIEALGLINREMAAAQATYPSRFRALAMLPLQDTEASIDMLDWAIDELGMVGVCISVNLNGASIAAPRLKPLYRRIAQRGVPVVLHPSFRSTAYSNSVKPSTAGGVGERVIDVSLGWVYDTSLAVMSLIANGIFDDSPGLTVLHPHTGGVMPYIMGRIDAALSVPKTREEFSIAKPVAEYLKENVYIDFASGATPKMLEMASEVYGREHVLFGSDYPFSVRASYNPLLDSLEEKFADQIRRNRLPGVNLGQPSGSLA